MQRITCVETSSLRRCRSDVFCAVQLRCKIPGQNGHVDDATSAVRPRDFIAISTCNTVVNSEHDATEVIECKCQ